MNITQSLKLQQVGNLSPALQQGLRLLEAPIQDLRATVAQMVARNPMLEHIEPTPIEPIDESDKREPPAELRFGEREYERIKNFFTHLEYGTLEAPTKSAIDVALETTAMTTSLQDDLLQQLAMLGLDATDSANMRYLIGSLDEHGILHTLMSELVRAMHTRAKTVERLIMLLQTLDPAGVGARTIQECLVLQLMRKQLDEEARLVDLCYEDLLKKRFNVIAGRLGCTTSLVQKLVASIGRECRMPGSEYAVTAKYIEPEVLIGWNGEKWQATLTGREPKVRLVPAYQKLNGNNKEEEKFLRDKITEGKVLIKNLNDRQATLLAVATAIVNEQQDYFSFGIHSLRPMIMADIASKVAMHEATISRTVAEKFMLAPQGLIPMRMFFTTAISTFGTLVSNASIKSIIADIIKGEDKRAPLSDEDIVMLLGQRRLTIARRTVAKYRGMLGILPSNLRKI